MPLVITETKQLILHASERVPKAEAELGLYSGTLGFVEWEEAEAAKVTDFAVFLAEWAGVEGVAQSLSWRGDPLDFSVPGNPHVATIAF